MPKPHWPADVKSDMKEAIIANRKYIVDDIKALFSAKMEAKKFMSTRATPDITFEDPLERFQGAEDLTLFFNLCKYLDNVNFKVRTEVHSAHEIILDWDIGFGAKGWDWLKVSVPMRSHILLEPAHTPGGSEKIFRLFEEWGGNVLLTEKTVKLPYLGLVHQSLRRFMGSMILWPAKKGLL